jgi:hypothetical protein
MGRHRSSVALLIVLLCVSRSGAADGQQPIGLEWEPIAPLPIPVRAAAAAVDRGHIYVVGGTSPAGRTGALQILDLETGAWSMGTSIPVATEWAGAVWFDDRLHVVGGVTGEVSASPQHWVYDPGRDSWTAARALPSPAAGAAVAATDSHIFVFGGIDGPRAHSANTMIFDGRTERWFRGESLPGPRINWSGAVAGGRILAAGGGTPGLDTTGELLSYDSDANTWTRLTPLALPREAHGAAASGRWFCVAGGRRAAPGNFNTPFEDATCYDVPNDAWIPLPALPRARQELVLVAANDVLYALGGRDVCGTPLPDALRLRLRSRTVVSAF